MVTFATLVSGVPAAVVTCRIGTNVIASPFQFPIGLSFVTCTASNTLGVAECGFTINVLDATPPVAGSNTLGAIEGKTVSVTVSNLLRADQSLRGGALSIPNASPLSADGGSVTLAGGVLSYVPPKGFAGPDFISYTLSDGCGTAQGLITVTVNPITPPLFQQVSRDGGLLISTLSGLLPGETVVLETSSDLINWLPVQTNAAVGVTLSMTNSIDSSGTGHFFRAAVQ
jgi:hypothetical protein